MLMARKPNYRFERMERERNKAAKKAARQEAKRQKAEERRLADGEGTAVSADSPEGAPEGAEHTAAPPEALD
jgi:hypothetical protein